MLNPVYATFLKAAESGSFSKAAALLYISPVSVMKQMNDLEEEIGVKLFVRSSRGVSLTDAGQVLYVQAVRLNKEAEKILDKVRAVSKNDKILIRVGSSMMRPAALLMNVCKRSAAIQSKYVLQISPFSDNLFGGKWLESALEAEFDCITSPYDAKEWQSSFNVLKLGEEKFKLAVPMSNPLSRRKSLTLEDLRGNTLLTPPRQSFQVDRLCAYLETNYPEIELRPLPDYYTANTFFDHADDILLTRDSFNVISSGFETVDVEWDFSSPTGIIYSLRPSQEMEEFAALLRQAAG